MPESYFSQLTTGIDRSWNKFWFTPSDPFSLGAVRIATGLMALYYVASHTADLTRWFGPDGLLPVETVQRLQGGGEESTQLFHLSYLNYLASPAELWIAHALGIVVLVGLILGFRTRIASIGSLVIVLSYVHRAPLLTGQFEPVLTMLLVYLCLAPSGAFLSFDSWLRERNKAPGAVIKSIDPIQQAKRSSATVALRLMQVHLTAFYLMMGLTKLAGETWWNGEAVWWLIAKSESRLVDFTFLNNVPYVVNGWTHLIVIFEIAFALLIWNRLARPLLLLISVIMWTSLAMITGLVSFCLIMLIANLVFIPSQTLRSWLAALTSQAEQSGGKASPSESD